MATTDTKRDVEEDTLDEAIQDEQSRIEELSSEDSDEEYEDVKSEVDGPPFPGKDKIYPKRLANLPPWLKDESFNLFHEDLETKTSDAQKDAFEDCVPLLIGEESTKLPLNSHGIPHLARDRHAKFLANWLHELPAPYVALDASRPWIFYWTMAGLSFLGKDVSQYKDRLMETVRPLQNPSGGFGGGHGQMSHNAGTYATILGLAAVGGLEAVDRKAMWHFMGQMKQADGGFTMAEGAEEDIRGAYCAMTAISLLNLPLTLPPDAPARQAGLETFTDRLGEWVGRCQTYEGGIAGAPTNEAHGAYAFCALACLSILDAPHISIPQYLDVPALIRWLAAIQTTPEGGFAGRANKLVDACYSHWVGGCWALIEAALIGTKTPTQSIWNREALIRYLLCCCQQEGKKGGMRDKPSMRPDAYHTCYSLAGLSAAQNHHFYDVGAPTRDSETGRLLAAFNWSAEGPTEEERKAWAFDAVDTVVPVHPIYVLPIGVVERTKRQFDSAEFV